MPSDTLRARLAYEPRELQFGTSGRRGEVVHLTPLEIYINVVGELEYLQAQSDIEPGDDFYFAYDLRPTSAGIAAVVAQAVRDAGLRPINMGRIPTPALTFYAITHGRGSIMVTGSHIPFDRNGYKTNTSCGELLKEHEPPINQAVARVRERLYTQPFSESAFDEHGRFKLPPPPLPPENGYALASYIDRYTAFFAGGSLSGRRLLAYQHSAVGRDLLVEVLERLGAEVVAAGRSDTFVPIDTENIDDEQLAAIQRLVDAAGRVDAVVSTDGDSDRPLLLGVDAARKVRFFSGDLVGMVVAEYLQADAVVVPISCNDAIDRGPLAGVLESKTRIGSPYVIAGMNQARGQGKRTICGWEANGGFLTGSDIIREGRTLRALPTRDALLPLLAVLFRASERGLSLPELFEQLPKRYSRAALLKQFPRPVALRILERFCAREQLEEFFSSSRGFAPIQRLDFTDGVRITFRNGEVAHLRPSGNADEFRIYAVADTQERADAIARMGVAEPDGILRSLERAAAQ
jgi:phosphomannomutase